MPGSGRVIRVSVLGLRVQDPRRYSVHVAATGADNSTPDLHKGHSARTETSPVSVNPDFMHKHLLLQLPCALGALLKPQAMLRCSVWAAPALDRGLAHVAADGRLSDELIGEGDVHVMGEASSRLLRGDRVTINASLAASSKLLPSNRMPHKGSGSSQVEVMLELMLIDAHVTLQRDLLISMRPPTELTGTTARAVIPGASECDLFVLISSARELPEVRVPVPQSGETRSHPPSPFVAAKSSRDIVHGGGVQGATHVVSSSCDPTWDEVLVVRYVENELEHERLVLAVVDDTSAALMGSCSIPLKSIAAGHYYNLKVPLTLTEANDNGSNERPESTIFVTVCLANAPCSEVQRWSRRQDKAMGALQLRLASCSVETHASASEDNFVGVFARLEVGDSPVDSDDASDGDSNTAAAEAVDFDDIYIELSGTTAEDNAALQDATSEWDMGAGEIVPILGNSAGMQLWPVSRMLLLALNSGSREESGIILSLHSVVVDEESNVIGQCCLPVRHLPEDGNGALVPYSNLAFRGGDEGGNATLEVRYWTSENYMSLLRTLAPAGMEPQQWTAAVPTVANGMRGIMAGASTTIECLVEDALLSQVAIQHIQRAADTAQQRCELAGWRLRDVDSKRRALHNDVAELRKLLHESRGTDLDTEEMSSLQKLPAEQLVHKCHAYVTRARAERAKNSELLRRLKDEHVHEVDAKKLAVHMGELQRAHLQQNRVVRELEEAVARVPMLKKTVRNQQQVIVSLQGLLRRAVVEVKDLKAANAQSASALDVATAARDSAEAAKSSAESAAARAQAKADSAVTLAMRTSKAKPKELKTKELHAKEAAAQTAPPTAQSLPTQTAQSLPVPMPSHGLIDPAPAAPMVQSLPLPARPPMNTPPEPVHVRSPPHTPDEVISLRKELNTARETMNALQKAAQEATAKEKLAVESAEAAQAASEAAEERAKQAEEAAQAADNDLLEATMSYAREMAQMKAKLVEKEAQLLGGFGSPEKLQDGMWAMPPQSPLGISPQSDRAFLDRQFGFGPEALNSTGKNTRPDSRVVLHRSLSPTKDGLPPINSRLPPVGRRNPQRTMSSASAGDGSKASGTGGTSSDSRGAAMNSRRGVRQTETTSGRTSGINNDSSSSGASSAVSSSDEGSSGNSSNS